jgi:histone H3/H4
VAFGVDFFFVETHVVEAVSEVVVVIIHHIAEEAVEVVEAAFVGGVGRA